MSEAEVGSLWIAVAAVLTWMSFSFTHRPARWLMRLAIVLMLAAAAVHFWAAVT